MSKSIDFFFASKRILAALSVDRAEGILPASFRQAQGIALVIPITSFVIPRVPYGE